MTGKMEGKPCLQTMGEWMEAYSKLGCAVTHVVASYSNHRYAHVYRDIPSLNALNLSRDEQDLNEQYKRRAQKVCYLISLAFRQ